MIPELKDYLAEVEEEREKKGLQKRKFSLDAFGSETRYSLILSTSGNVGVKSLKALAETLDKKLVICLMDKE